MWDSNSPLQLLKSMPQKLSKENLEKLQMVIDADKYKNSLISGFELCGMYAPFCRGCKKTSIYPCAVAYVNMMKENGMAVEIDAKPVDDDQMLTAAADNVAEVTDGSAGESKKQETNAEADESTENRLNNFSDEVPLDSVHEAAPAADDVKPVLKGKIRIAVARRKL